MRVAEPFDASWHPADPDRGCYSCGALPTSRYEDGSPRYSCGPHTPVKGPEGWTPPAYRPRHPGYRLGDADLRRADAYAHRMHDRGKGRRDRLDTDSLLEWRIASARAEMAFGRMTGLPVHFSDTGFGKPDVGPYQVRWSEHGRLKIALRDLGRDDPVVAMSGPKEGDTFRAQGWLRHASDGAKEEFLDNPNGWGEAWFVPWELLADPWTIPEMAR